MYGLSLILPVKILDMTLAERLGALNRSQLFRGIQTVYPCLPMFRLSHFTSMPNQNTHISFQHPSLEQGVLGNNVAIFWDLDNKPPKSFPPYDAATKLKKAAQRFGFVKYMIAYANQHTFSYVPPLVRAKRRDRKALNQLETIGVVKPDEPYVCRVCGRRFYANEKLVNHFKQIHEREHVKRLNQIESARGSKRLKLVAKYAMKMDKYRNAARDILTPKVGYGLVDELKRGGFWVRAVSDNPQAADVALRHHIMDMMDKRTVECLFLVSDDSDFVGVLKEARLRCLKTVVVGDINDGALKRTADAAFSWQEIMMEKAKKDALSVVGRWKDQSVLQKLEWTYDPETEKKLYFDEIESEGSDIECYSDDSDGSILGKENDGAWWELDYKSKEVARTPE